MELEHVFHQSGFLVAFQLLVIVSFFAPGLFIEGLLQRFIKTATAYIVSFGPIAILIYVLFRISRLS